MKVRLRLNILRFHFPYDLYPLRPNSSGFDLNNDQPLAALDTTAQKLRSHIWKSAPLLGFESTIHDQSNAIAITNPAQNSETLSVM